MIEAKTGDQVVIGTNWAHLRHLDGTKACGTAQTLAGGLSNGVLPACTERLSPTSVCGKHLLFGLII